MIEARHPNRRRFEPGLWSVILALACSGTDSGLPDADALPRLTATEELRIGNANDPDIGFSRILGVDVDRDGNVYVFESLADEIRVFDREGNRIRTWGGPGSGPGEFRSATGFGVVGDTIYVVDSLNRRITLFSLEGEILAELQRTRVQLETGNPGVTANVSPDDLRPDGLFEGSAGYSVFRPEVTDDPIVTPRVLFDATGAIIDTVGADTIPATAFSEDLSAQMIELGGVRMLRPEMPPDNPYMPRVQDDRVHIERPHATDSKDAWFSVTRWTRDGDTLFHHRLRYTPIPYDAVARDRLIEDQAERYRGRDGADIDAIRRGLGEMLELPPYQNPVTTARTGDDGTLWIRREDHGGDHRQWIIIAADGTIRGQFELPRNAEFRYARGDEIWVIEPDAMEVPWLVRYRIE